MKESFKILIMANYSNQTGFAWNNIYGLFSHVSRDLRAKGCSVSISFNEIKEPVGKFYNDFDNIFQLSPCSLRLKDIWNAVLLIRKENISGLYLTDQKPCNFVYLIYRLAGIKKIINHCRTSVPSPDPVQPDFILRSFVKTLVASVKYLNCDAIYAVSEFVKQRLVVKARVPSQKVYVIVNGIDTKKFSPFILDRDNGQLGDVKIFCGCRASKYKGFQYLLEAIHILVHDRGVKNLSLIYAGDGPDLNFLKKFAKTLGVEQFVNFLGEVRSTCDFQREADIVVVPSVWGDACPSAVSEALSCGKPLIATRVGGIPEMVGDSKSAFLVPHSDSGSIADALEKLVKCPSLRKKMGKQGRARAIEALDVNRYHQEVVSRLLADFGINKR